MKTVKAASGERRAHRKAKDRRRDRLVIQAIGGRLDPELVERIRTAALTVDPGAPWPELAPKILPVLKRVWHPYPPEIAPLEIEVPPGIQTGFGIDFGPAFSHVSRDLVERWGIDELTLLATALDTLRRVVASEPPRIERFRHQGWDVVAICGHGWGSSLLLLPDALQPILGDKPLALLAPVRNHLLAVSTDVTIDAVADLWGALADGANDELDVPPLFWDGASVVRHLGGPVGLLH